MKKYILYHIITYIVLLTIISLSICNWISIFKEEKTDLISYKVIDVIKDKGVYLLIELNNHYYLLNKSSDNYIFQHYKKCPFCKKDFKQFIFSIYDGYTSKLQEKYKKLKNDDTISKSIN